MKRKAQNDIDEYVMIKCQKFVFAPKDNKVINFCYTFEESDTESGDDGDDGPVVPVIPIMPVDPESSDKGPVIELIEDSVITPVASNEVIAPVPEKLQITEKRSFDVPEHLQVTENCTFNVPERLQITESLNIVPENPVFLEPERSKTPDNYPTTVPEPDSPEENRMLRNLKISDGTFTLEKSKYLGFLRAKAAVDEEKKVLKQQWDEFEARVGVMARIELEMKSQLEEVFRVRVGELMAEMMRVEEVYKGEVAREREMRMEMEARVNEMAAYIQQQGVSIQQGNNYVNHQQAQQQVNHNQQQELFSSHHQIDFGPKVWYMNDDPYADQPKLLFPAPKVFDKDGNAISCFQKMEMEEMEEMERQWEIQKRQSEERQRAELERQRQLEMEKQRQLEEQRRLEMRKMQHMRHVQASSVDDKIKEEQNKLYAIQEEKSKSSFNPFALLKMVPNPFGWKSPPATQSQSTTTVPNTQSVTNTAPQNVRIWANSPGPAAQNRPPGPNASVPMRPAGNKMETDPPAPSASGRTPSKPKTDLSQFRR